MGLQSRAHFDALGGTYEEGWPLGAGAYQISERTDDGTVVLDANPYYYKEGYPKTACIRIEKVAEDSDRVLLLQDGRADLISDIPYSGAAYTDLTEGIDVLEFPSTLCRYLVMNGEAQPALADPRVRQALVMATDFDLFRSFARLWDGTTPLREESQRTFLLTCVRNRCLNIIA